MIELSPAAWTAIAAIVATLCGGTGLGGYFIARANARPALQAAAETAAMAATKLLLDHYPSELSRQGRVIEALRGDVAELSAIILQQTATISGQTETIEGLENHIDVLGEVMKAAGLPIPQRKPRAAKKDPV